MAMAKPKKPARVSWADKLWNVRHDLRLTQAEAAARIHVSQSLWSEWENGKREPNDQAKLLLKFVFGIE